MEGSTEPIAVRIARMNNMLLGKKSHQSSQQTAGKLLVREDLLDAFTVLYEECNNESMRRDKNVSKFLEKYQNVTKELHRLRVNLADFEVKKLIGRGHFGDVQLVKEKQTGDIYAMKTLRKAETLKQEAVVLYEEERDVMAEATSPWLTKLQYAFQDNQNLYLVMEFHPGGDLAALLDRHDGCLGEVMSRFYLAEMSLAINALHLMNYAHRDIKPENILLDRLGHVKLADFGSAAKLGSRGLISSQMPVGTPEYIAPEVLRSMEGTSKNKRPSTYGKECDYWSLGIVAYEMVYGKTPFSGDQLLETYCNIMNHKKNLSFPDGGSASFKNLVRGLLEDANARMTHEQVLQHSFFSSTDWSNIRSRAPPLVPLVNGVDDTSNFLAVDKDVPRSPTLHYQARVSCKDFSGRNLPFVGFTYVNQSSARCEKASKEQKELEVQLENKKREVQEYQKKLLTLQDKTSSSSKVTSDLESQLCEKTRKIEAFNKERDRIERELAAARADLSGMKRTLDLERQERRDLETRALDLIKGAKRKWETAEKDKIAQLNKHIESQTMRITELCTSNNEMSSRLQRAECELDTANAELHKLRVFQVQYKESLAKTRELSRQSVQGVENKLEEMASRAHNQLSDLRAKLELETAKNTELESALRNEQDANHCRQSRFNVALELAQSELKDCQEQLRSLQASIPVRDTEIETLRNQLKEKARQLDTASASEQTIATLQENLERLRLENEHLKDQLENAKLDLNETMLHLEDNQSLALNLEQVTQDRVALQQRLQDSIEKEEEHLRKVGNLEELLRRLERSVTKLEAENASLKLSDRSQPSTSGTSNQEVVQKNIYLEQQIQKLEQHLNTSRENVAAERQAAKLAQSNLWKKEKELSDANLDKRIATREAKTAEERIKQLQEEKKKLSEKLSDKIKEEEARSKKLLKELETAKSSLEEITREASRNKSQADSAQRALTQTNKQIEELQASSASLRREFDATRKQMRTNQDRVDSLNAENKRLTLAIAKHNEEKSELESKVEKLQQEVNGAQVNIELLKETCTVLEEQLTDYERLTSDHETRENMLIQDKMKLQKDLEALELKLREARAAQNEEKTLRLVAERTIERLESETSDVEGERNGLVVQRDQYKKLTQDLSKQVAELSARCGELECDLSETERALETAKGEARVIKEECSQHLTRVHELKDANFGLMADLQASVDQGQELKLRIAELEGVLEEMRQFYQEREVKAEGTRQQQTKLIDYLQLKLEECSKKKKTVCDKIFGTKQKENLPPSGTGMPVGYRELENQLARERAKVKTLTEQLLALKAAQASAPTSPSPPTPETRKVLTHLAESPGDSLAKRPSLRERMRHNIPHRFSIGLPMRTGKCSACLDSIQFGTRAAICSDCQIMTHPKCSASMPANCGLPGGFAKHFSNSWKASEESLSSLGDSVQTLALDQPDNLTLDEQTGGNAVSMESWVKLPGRAKANWERKYLRLEGASLNTYEHQPSQGMSPVSTLDLTEKGGFEVLETVQHAEVSGTAKSDLPFILRIESKQSTTCWPTNRMDIMALNQADKKAWLKALKSIVSQNATGKATHGQRCQTILRLDKHQLDLNCALDVGEEGVLLLGAEEGLFSYRSSKSQALTAIRGVKRVHQLSLHPQLGLALMIAGEDRQLVSCDLRLLKSNALAAECSRPAINTKAILSSCESCHLYQVQGEMLCAATASHIILLKWVTGEDSGEFIAVRELETQEPCSCAIFARNILVVGCHKFFQIDLRTYEIEEFPEEDDNSVKVTLMGAAKIGIFPVCVLNVSSTPQSIELLLCYNEFGVFVNQKGQRTRSIDPTWSHLPFAFAFRKPYLFIVHFSSVEVVKLTYDSYKNASTYPERVHVELNNPRYLGAANSKSIYISAINSSLEVLKIDGASVISNLDNSMTSLDTIDQEDESSSEFSFTSSLMEALDGQGKRVHFAKVTNH